VPPVPPTDPNIARYRAAVELIRVEADRLFQTFAAFLVAEALVAGFLLNAVDQSSEPAVIIVAAVFGFVVCGLWYASYERHAETYTFRVAQASEAEPDGWDLLRHRGKDLADGDKVPIPGEREKPFGHAGLAKVKTRCMVRVLMGMFALAFAGLFVVGVVQAA
jgi:hypothetical protein